MPEEISQDLVLLSDRLVSLSVSSKLLPGNRIENKKETLKKSDYLRLLNEASVLAFSRDPHARMLAYEIATHSLALKTKESPSLLHAVDFILARLANFPGRNLLRQHHHATFEKNPGSPVLLLLESLVRERENTVKDLAHPLTDFQLDFFHSLETESAVSISAPTSAGKSFVLSQHIIRKLRSIPGCCIIYLVPTRALIHEVMLRLRKELGDTGLHGVAQRCVPLPPEGEIPNGVVFVLTQERLLSLLHLWAEGFKIDLLIVDEAQGVRDGARGVLLQTGVEQALARCPKADVVFASPLISNPKYFLDLFTHAKGHYSLELHSPVGQNLIVVEQVASNSRRLCFELLRHGDRISLGLREISVEFGTVGLLQQRAMLAFMVTGENDSCLVYANGAAEAEDLAHRLASLRTNSDPNKEVLEFISYIEEHIHPEYPLIETLRRGVAFHHGEMPASVRSGVEDLFRDRKLSFICCTSTLLQGVNLPARHLIVDRPRRGSGQPLQPADFLNLAGRAGRLRREFNGNVWCLNASSWKRPPQDRTELPTVEASFESTVREKPEQLNQLIEGGTTRIDRDGVFTATIGRLLTEYVFTGRMPQLPQEETKKTELVQAIQTIQGFVLKLPKEVFVRNSTVLPGRLEQLYLTLLAKEDIDLWIPPPPFKDECYDFLLRVFELLQTEVENRQGLLFKFDAILTVKWIRQQSLRQIIEARLEWQRKNQRPANPRIAIRSIIRAIERRMRFELVRSLRAYHDVLAAVLKWKKRDEDAELLRPFYLYVECGGYKPSFLSLVSLGFSRTSALILLKAFRLPDDLSPEQCRERILQINLAAAKVPDLVRREVRQLLGRSRR